MGRQEIALRYFRNMSETARLRERTGIELNRKGNAEITVVVPEGKTMPDEIILEVEQKNHEFRFGANIFMLDEMESPEKNAAYREKFADVFNLATLPFYWDTLEPERGKPRFSADSPGIYRRPPVDRCIDYCREHKIEPKLHCLNYDRFAPAWVNELSELEYRIALEERMRAIAERYANVIPSIEVTNETLHRARSADCTFQQADDLVEWSFRTADKYFPHNHFIINESISEIHVSMGHNNRNPYYMQIERLLWNGITHLDSIGLQYHSMFDRSLEEKIAASRYNPDWIWGLLDLYGRFGLPEQITEITIPAYSHDTEDEETQAELLCALYRTFFAHPAMEAIIYWNLVDGYAHLWTQDQDAIRASQGDMTRGENRWYGGLLRFDMTEKPAYAALKKLIHEEWHTSLRVPVIRGKASFRGFYGDYRITAHANGKAVSHDFTLSKYKSAAAQILL
ncbi:MAG: endo-1,4-beta-xylanase [Clostridia bacterium]|nr:endo-1,4-beta-xylanase [Clostridia bacterium]